MDGRLGWRILRGKVLFAGNMTKDEAKYWIKTPWPPAEEFLQKAKALEKRITGITANFRWESPRKPPREPPREPPRSPEVPDS